MFNRIDGGNPFLPLGFDKTAELEEIAPKSDQPPKITNESITDILTEGRAMQQERAAEQELSGQLQRAQLESQLKGVQKTDVLGKSSFGKEVQTLQKQMNEWRVANGQTPIKEDGIFGQKTEEAVKEFQTATGLKTDGLAGPNTKGRLELENSADFQKLSSSVKDEIRTKMNRYQAENIMINNNTMIIHGPEARNNLLKLVKDPNFNNASHQTQHASLDALSKNPADVKHREQVAEATTQMSNLEHHNEFQKLSPTVQHEVRSSMFAQVNDPSSRSYITDLASTFTFAGLTEQQQRRVLDAAHVTNDGMNNLGAVDDILHSSVFAQMNHAEKDHLLEIVSRHAHNPRKLGELETLLHDANFVEASKEEQQAHLREFEQ